MILDNLIIEVTRRCNLQCCHCLRGEAENIDIDLKYVEEIFSKIDGVNILTFTGGEPSLVVPKMVQILQIAKDEGIKINNFYIATNGTNSSDKFIKFLMDMYLYCINNEITQVDISNDCYHDIDEIEENRKKLQCLSFVSNKFKRDGYDYFERHIGSLLIKEGNNEGGEGRELKELKEQEIYIEDYDDNYEILIEGDIYLNCLGFIIKGCDFSYVSQNKPENIFCHVYNFQGEIEVLIENEKRK
jgi:organic radical activating enzyme